ncbi:MAG: TolC family protein [Bdellovibrionales bacterium]
MNYAFVLFSTLVFSSHSFAQVPKITEAIEEAMRTNPSIEAAEAQLKGLKAIRVGVLLNLASVTYSRTQAFGRIQSQGLEVDGGALNSLGQVGFTIAPAAIFAFKGLGSSIQAQKNGLIALKQAITLELIRIWLDFYNQEGAIQSYKNFLQELDKLAVKVKAGQSPTKEADYQQVLIARNDMNNILNQTIQATELGRIDYVKVVGKDPILLPPTTPGSSEGDDDDIEKLKKTLDSVFPLPTVKEALDIAMMKNPQVLAASFMRDNAKVDLNASRITPWLPNLTIGRGRIDTKNAFDGIPDVLTNQTSVTLSWSLSPGQIPVHQSKLSVLQSAQFSEATARRETTASVQKAFVQLNTLNQLWITQADSFKRARAALLAVKDPSVNVAESLNILRSFLAVWSGPTGFVSLTSNIFLVKASAHAQMGTLFEQIEKLKQQGQ